MMPRTKRALNRATSPRPRKSAVGNVILSAAFGVVVFVVMQNFRVLSGLQKDNEIGIPINNNSGGMEQPPPQQQQQQYNTPAVSLDDESITTLVVWTYPSAPDLQEPTLLTTPLDTDEILLCSYPPCGSLSSQRLDLREFTRDDPILSDFVRKHAHYKLQQAKGDDASKISKLGAIKKQQQQHHETYLHHVQSIALLSLIRRYPQKCAKTWGSSQTICGSDLVLHARYNPATSSSPIVDIKKIPSFAQIPFNVLSYDSKVKLLKEANLEDELQSLAAAQFMPHVTNFVDRDSGLNHVQGHLICSARFRSTFVLASKALTDIWDTIFPSIQLRYDAKNTVKQHKWLFEGYTEKSGAIGAEDATTLEFLQQEEIKSYLALSFNLMLFPQDDDDFVGVYRNETIILDVKPGLLPPLVEKNAISLQRTIKEPDRGKRLASAQEILSSLSQKAQLVITSRIQMGLPALSMGIPVVYVGMKEYLDNNGVGDFFHVFDPYNGDTWTFDSNKMPPTLAGIHRADRARASFWNVLKRESAYYSNTAYLYGMVPFKRLGRLVESEEPLHNSFHFIFTTPPKTFTWREKRAIEHVFYFHPNAKVIVHSNTLKQGNCYQLDIFAESGYDLTIEPYDLSDLLQQTIADTKLVNSFIAQLEDFAKGEHWYSHETDILRYLLLLDSGGVYLDTDMYLVKPLVKSELSNVVAYQDPNHDYVSGAVMIFEPHHALLKAALQWTLENYAARRTEWPVLGSTLMTELSKNEEYRDTFTILDDASFYPIDWESIDTCFTHELPNLQLANTYGVHLNSKITSHYVDTTKGTFCDKLLHAYCIFCDEIHTAARTEEPEIVVEEKVHEEDPDFHDFLGLDPDELSHEKPPEEKKAKSDGGPSFFSRFVSGMFGSRRKNKAPPKKGPDAVRKSLPPVHMEFVKKQE